LRYAQVDPDIHVNKNKKYLESRILNHSLIESFFIIIKKVQFCFFFKILKLAMLDLSNELQLETQIKLDLES
jgi:hypothetical protein